MYNWRKLSIFCLFGEIMRKIISILLAIFMLATLAACETARPVAEPEVPSASEPATTTETTPETAPAQLLLPGMPMEFAFSSGAGAWATVVTVNPDGTFTGNYTDSNMGNTGDGYPNGERYVCDFSGKFTAATKIGDYEYSMKLERLDILGPEKEEIVDGVLIIPADPYGFEDAEEFRLYLPGRPTADLAEAFVRWAGVAASDGAELPFYGLYNVGGQKGFVGD
jgi:predicted small lipoprotein YifL